MRQPPAISTPNSSNLILQGSLEYKGNDVVLRLACNDSTLAEKLVAGVKKMVTEHIPAGQCDKVRSAESAVRSYRTALVRALCYSAVHSAV